MIFSRENFRRWWQYPRRFDARPPHRSVSFLELFYDLVYVALIAELAHSLATHVDASGLATYLFLFAIVWLSWLNGSAYHDSHGNNDIRTRVFTFIQMILVALMAVFAHNATGEGAVGFAISYGLFSLTLTILWWRASYHDPNHRTLGYPYTIAFFVSALLFLSSAFLPEGMRFYLWGGSIFIALALPIVLFFIGRNHPKIQARGGQSFHVSDSLVERFGLFTIIVLGEVIIGAVNGLGEHHHQTATTIATGVLGVLAAVGLWWIYFDSVSHRTPHPRPSTYFGWMYLHLPLTASIAAVGAAVLNIVEHAGEPIGDNVRWLLVSSVVIVMLTTALMINTVKTTSGLSDEVYHNARNMLVVSAILVFGLGFLPLSSLITLSLIVLLLVLPIYAALHVFLRHQDAG